MSTRATKILETLNVIEEDGKIVDLDELSFDYPWGGDQNSPNFYRNKFGEFTTKKKAVLKIIDKDVAQRMEKGKPKGKPIDMGNYGRDARSDGKNRRAWDGAKLDNKK